MSDDDNGKAADPEITLALLEAIERDSRMTHRSAASELGIALGLAHAYMKRCINKGLIKVQQVPPRRYAYYLTPHGFVEKSRLTAQYLSHSLKLFKRTRSFFDETFQSVEKLGVTSLVLAGPEDMAEVIRLMAQDHGIAVLKTIPIELSEPIADAAARIAQQLAATPPEAAVLVTDFARADQLTAALEPLIGAGRVVPPPSSRK